MGTEPELVFIGATGDLDLDKLSDGFALAVKKGVALTKDIVKDAAGMHQSLSDDNTKRTVYRKARKIPRRRRASTPMGWITERIRGLGVPRTRRVTGIGYNDGGEDILLVPLGELARYYRDSTDGLSPLGERLYSLGGVTPTMGEMSLPEAAAMLEGLVKLNEVQYGNGAGLISEAIQGERVRYDRRDQDEKWQSVSELLLTGRGDCEDLSAALAAELRFSGADPDAKVVIKPGKGRVAHAVVESKGEILDPSVDAGMGWNE